MHDIHSLATTTTTPRTIAERRLYHVRTSNRNTMGFLHIDNSFCRNILRLRRLDLLGQLDHRIHIHVIKKNNNFGTVYGMCKQYRICRLNRDSKYYIVIGADAMIKQGV